MGQQENDKNRRTYERFTVGFKINIYDAESGQKLLDKSELHDISDGGICFLTHSPGLYHSGQPLYISISLPGTDMLDARLEGNATVAWVGEEREEMQGASVGISMDELLDFKRDARAVEDDESSDT